MSYLRDINKLICDECELIAPHCVVSEMDAKLKDLIDEKIRKINMVIIVRFPTARYDHENDEQTNEMLIGIEANTILNKDYDAFDIAEQIYEKFNDYPIQDNDLRRKLDYGNIKAISLTPARRGNSTIITIKLQSKL